jgi:methyl-accepting chemotaxis protein
MDKVVQQNAASAEESASASEEMNAQAMQMRQFVGDLVAMVGGNGISHEAHGSQIQDIGQMKLPKTKEKRIEPPPSKRIEVRPEDLIPLDEDFNDF